MGSPGSQTPDFWTKLYQSAIAEPDRGKRLQRLLAAERAVLERAVFLEEKQTEQGAEATALKEAIHFIREMKMRTMSDGVGMEVSPGDKDLRL